MGRCARNLNGRAILYADRMTDSMKKAMGETDRRRAVQQAYNEANGITPESIIRPLDMSLARIIEADYADLTGGEAEGIPEFKSQEELDIYIGKAGKRYARGGQAIRIRKGREAARHDQRTAYKRIFVRLTILTNATRLIGHFQ